jgi:signal transduction histidine kinase
MPTLKSHAFYSARPIVSSTAPLTPSRALRRSARPIRPVFSVLAALNAYRISQRRRLAREMHDDFGQLLATMKLDLSMLERETAADGAAYRHVQHLQQLVDTMISSVRRVVSEQPPRVLEEVGLVSAIEQLVDDFRTRHKLLFALEVKLQSPDVSMHLQQAIYRILQETLTNIVRHADASLVQITIESSGPQVRVRIADDGKGAAATDFSKPNSVGLAWMHERVATLGGEMQIASTPGSGTSIDILLPASRQGVA